MLVLYSYIVQLEYKDELNKKLDDESHDDLDGGNSEEWVTSGGRLIDLTKELNMNILFTIS